MRVDGGQLLSHIGDGVPVVRGTEYGGTGNEGVGAGCRNCRNVVDLYAAIYLQADISATGVDHLSCPFQFIERCRNKALTRESGVDGHE